MRIRLHAVTCRLFLVGVLLVSTTSSVGQSLSVRDEIILAEDVSEDYRERPRAPLLTDTVFNDLVDYAMRDLLNTEYVVRSKLTYRWEWFVLDDPTPNAGAHIGGKLVVNAGLSKALGYDQGLWAAVLAHEIGHSLYRHPVVLLERNLSKQNMQSYSPQSARSALFTYLGLWGRRLLDLKISRDEESKADEAGLFLLAAAGYPPDFGVVMHQRFRQAMGDRSGWDVFFNSTHPRHKTREDRTYKAYQKARELYESRWGNRRTSLPPPPAWGIVEKPVARKEKRSDGIPGLSISTKVILHNTEGEDLRVIALFQDDGIWIKSPHANYQTEDGYLKVSKTETADEIVKAGSVSLFVPFDAVDPKRWGKKASVGFFIFDSDQLLGESEFSDIKFLSAKDAKKLGESQ